MCSVDGCGNALFRKGMCSRHYHRLRRIGSFDGGDRAHASLEIRFHRAYQKLTKQECWIWGGARTKKGYGVIQAGGRGSKLLLAHRVSYQLHTGSIPDGKSVLHSCDNPWCVNPFHLRAGTASENIQEAFDKGRKRPYIAFGEQNPKSKLTQEQADFIKANPTMRLIDLAAMFGVSPNCVRGVRIGRTWTKN